MARSTTVTTEQIVQSTTNKLASDITALSARKAKALSMFRQTAEELSVVNGGLQQSLDTLSGLQSFINEQTASTNKMIADNEAVRSKILDIIGE